AWSTTAIIAGLTPGHISMMYRSIPALTAASRRKWLVSGDDQSTTVSPIIGKYHFCAASGATVAVIDAGHWHPCCLFQNTPILFFCVTCHVRRTSRASQWL